MTPFTPLAEDQDFDYDLCLQIADRDRHSSWLAETSEFSSADKEKGTGRRAQCQGNDMIVSQSQMIL